MPIEHWSYLTLKGGRNDMKIKKESFVFHKQHYEAIKGLIPQQKGLLLDAICDYAFSGEVIPATDAVVFMAFSFIRQQIDRDMLKYEEVCENNRQNAKKGGAPKGNQNAKKTTEEIEAIETTKNNPNNRTVEKTSETTLYDNYINMDYDNNIKVEKKERSNKKFVAPTLIEISNFVLENKLSNVNPTIFFDYYVANGWKVGKNSMKDWNAALRMWNARNTNTTAYKHPANEIIDPNINDQILKF